MKPEWKWKYYYMLVEEEVTSTFTRASRSDFYFHYSGHASTSTFTHTHLRPWTVGGRVVSDGTYFVHSDIDIEFTLVQDGFGFGGSTEA